MALDEEEEWKGHICETAEQCPIAGFWEQVETGDIVWHETQDKFPELESTPSSYKRARYKYLGKSKPSK